MSKPKKRRNHLPPRVLPPGWSTSDTDEIERRRMRGVNEAIRIIWPSGSGRERRSRTRDILLPFFTDSNRLRGEPVDGLPALERAINAAHAAVKRRIRISNELNAWLGMLDRRAQQLRSRQHFEAEVSAVKASVSAVTNSRPPRNSGQR